MLARQKLHVRSIQVAQFTIINNFMSLRGGTRTSLPTINNPNLTYSQRYEHMTKLANYSEMNETQIWKQYQKLRACLKELNEEVLYHMEKKTYGSIGSKDKPHPSTKDQEGTLVLTQDQKKANDTRLHTYHKELQKHEERIKYLTSHPNYLEQLIVEGQNLQLKIKQVTKENKDLHRNAELQGRDLVNGPSMLDKLLIEEQKLNRAFKHHKKYDQHMKILKEKIDRFKEKNADLQKAVDLRVQQFSKSQNYIAEQIHYDHYEQLKRQKQVINKYEPVYKRNYLMKLKELESIVNNISKQDRIIQENQANLVSVRNQIQTITALVGVQRKRNMSSLLNKKQEKMANTHRSVAIEAGSSDNPLPPQPTSLNDKNG